MTRADHTLTDPAQANVCIGVAASQCGFGNASVFSRAFRQAFGISPTDLRANHQRFDEDNTSLSGDAAFTTVWRQLLGMGLAQQIVGGGAALQMCVQYWQPWGRLRLVRFWRNLAITRHSAANPNADVHRYKSLRRDFPLVKLSEFEVQIPQLLKYSIMDSYSDVHRVTSDGECMVPLAVGLGALRKERLQGRADGDAQNAQNPERRTSNACGDPRVSRKPTGAKEALAIFLNDSPGDAIGKQRRQWEKMNTAPGSLERWIGQMRFAGLPE